MLREARAANRVDHAHIIDIHDIGETDDGELYLVMEYLIGTPLSAELARGAMALRITSYNVCYTKLLRG